MVLFAYFCRMKQSKDKISVVINTRNAARHLEQVLTCVQAFDEVLVCDMESTDETLEIARRHNCRIVTFPKGNHNSAEPARNFAIQSATCDWVLVVDADELVTSELRNYLYRRISEPDCPAGLYIPRHNRFMGHYTRSIARDHQLRFFRKDGTVWPPHVHTFPSVKGRTERIPASERNVRFIHLADESISQLLQKTDRYTNDEVLKHAGKRNSLWALFFRPAWRFLRSYVLKLGFLDGRPGLIQAGMAALYQFVEVAKAIEADERSKQTSSSSYQSVNP